MTNNSTSPSPEQHLSTEQIRYSTLYYGAENLQRAILTDYPDLFAPPAVSNQAPLPKTDVAQSAANSMIGLTAQEQFLAESRQNVEESHEFPLAA